MRIYRPGANSSSDAPPADSQRDVMQKRRGLSRKRTTPPIQGLNSDLNPDLNLDLNPDLTPGLNSDLNHGLNQDQHSAPPATQTELTSPPESPQSQSFPSALSDIDPISTDLHTGIPLESATANSNPAPETAPEAAMNNGETVSVTG